LPIIVDIVDNYSIFSRFGEQRQRYYKKLGYTIDNYYAVNSGVVTRREFMKHRQKLTDAEIDSEFKEDNYTDYSTNYEDIFDISDIINYNDNDFKEVTGDEPESKDDDDEPIDYDEIDRSNNECMFG
jgi:hypothetical protein